GPRAAGEGFEPYRYQIKQRISLEVGNDQRAFAARGRRVVMIIYLNGRESEDQAAVNVDATAAKIFGVVRPPDQPVSFDQLAQQPRESGTAGCRVVKRDAVL